CGCTSLPLRHRTTRGGGAVHLGSGCERIHAAQGAPDKIDLRFAGLQAVSARLHASARPQDSRSRQSGGLLMPSWPRAYSSRLAVGFFTLLILSGCAGWAPVEPGICESPSWECVTSVPVYSERRAVDRITAQPPSDSVARELDRRLKGMIAADRRQ